MKKSRIILLCIITCIANGIFSQSNFILAGQQGQKYYDIVPDTFLNTSNGQNEYYNIDMNQDGTNDIQIHSFNSVSPGSTNYLLSVSSLNSATKIVLGNIDSLWHPFLNTWYTWNILKQYNTMDTICDTSLVNSAYLSYFLIIAGSGNNNSTWVNIGYKFFGIRYVSTNDTLYGWVMVNVTGYNTCYVKEYSLGGLVNGIKYLTEDLIDVYPNPVTDKIIVKSRKIFEIKFFDWMNKEILRTDENEIDVSNLQNGIYFIQIKTSEGVLTKKIVVQR